MGEGDYMPSGGHHRKYDPQHATKIKESGRKAKGIRDLGNQHQKAIDEPRAEKELLEALKKLDTDK